MSGLGLKILVARSPNHRDRGILKREEFGGGGGGRGGGVFSCLLSVCLTLSVKTDIAKLWQTVTDTFVHMKLIQSKLNDKAYLLHVWNFKKEE